MGPVTSSLHPRRRIGVLECVHARTQNSATDSARNRHPIAFETIFGKYSQTFQVQRNPLRLSTHTVTRKKVSVSSSHINPSIVDVWGSPGYTDQKLGVPFIATPLVHVMGPSRNGAIVPIRDFRASMILRRTPLDERASSRLRLNSPP